MSPCFKIPLPNRIEKHGVELRRGSLGLRVHHSAIRTDPDLDHHRPLIDAAGRIGRERRLNTFATFDWEDEVMWARDLTYA